MSYQIHLNAYVILSVSQCVCICSFVSVAQDHGQSMNLQSCFLCRALQENSTHSISYSKRIYDVRYVQCPITIATIIYHKNQIANVFGPFRRNRQSYNFFHNRVYNANQQKIHSKTKPKLNK